MWILRILSTSQGATEKVAWVAHLLARCSDPRRSAAFESGKEYIAWWRVVIGTSTMLESISQFVREELAETAKEYSIGWIRQPA